MEEYYQNIAECTSEWEECNVNKISVVVPCFNEEEVLPAYYREMCRIMEQMYTEEFELIFVDDGSRDHTLEILKSFHDSSPVC